MTIIAIKGAALGDVTFTTDKKLLGVEIVWNVTRIQRDANEGFFGRPEIISMSRLPPMSTLNDANVDWLKINAMLCEELQRPGDSVLNRPILQVLVSIGDKVFRLPVDGNHRLAARRIAGYQDFSSYVVPLELEQRYRIVEQVIE